jgi:phage tail-like protein
MSTSLPEHDHLPAPGHAVSPATLHDRLPNMSERRLLRDALPPVLRESATATDERPPLIERWLQGCEEVLDPVQTLLDNLPYYVDPRLAPPAMLVELGRWLGMEFPPELGERARRALLLDAAWLTKWRGTRQGLEHAFSLACPELTLTVKNPGAVAIGSNDGTVPTPLLDVSSAAALDPAQRAVVRWLIEDHLPAHMSYRLTEGPPAPS